LLLEWYWHKNNTEKVSVALSGGSKAEMSQEGHANLSQRDTDHHTKELYLLQTRVA